MNSRTSNRESPSPRWLGWLALTVFTVSWSAAAAQGACRSPTEAERASMTRAQEIVRQVVEQGLKDSAWEAGEWQLATVVARTPNAPRAPMEACDDLAAVKLTLRNDSDLAHRLDSIAAASQKAMQGDGASAANAAAMFDAVAGKTVSLRVFANEPYLFSPWPGKPGEVLVVPGVPFATREIAHAADGTTHATAELYLGDFAAAKRHVRSKEYVPYPFKRGKGPYFENVEIKLDGTPASIEDVVRRIDWAKLGGLLTP